ncbi:hypothetical protein ACPCTO_37225 [Streptomyces olivoreticuli]
MTTGDLICAAGFELVFAPWLAPGGAATVTTMASLNGCASPNGRHPDLRFGVTEAGGEATGRPVDTRRCSGLQAASGTGIITWSPVKSRSRFAWKVSVSPVNGAITFSATITHGMLKGDTIMAGPVTARAKAPRPSAGLESLTSELAVVVFG